MLMFFNKIKLICVIFIIFILTSCNNEPAPTQSKNEVSSWIGVYEGQCPSYNMTNKSGDIIEIYGDKVTVEETDWTFTISIDKCSIIMKTYDGIEYLCNDISYKSTNNSITLSPDSNSNCGGDQIIITQSEKGLYTVSGGSFGQPAFRIKKQ